MLDTATVEELVEQLQRAPAPPKHARRRPAQGGVPPTPGIYAWWSQTEAVGELPLARVPGSNLWLLFVGGAPTRPGSAQTLRARICGSDLRGGPADSSLRRILIALLWQDQGWEVGHRGTRIMLRPGSLDAFARWQEDLSVSWVEHTKPWLERAAIAKVIAAPLNLAEDRNHPYHWLVSEARQRLRSAALAGPEVAR